jgi:predicted HNH restriction endonuclease
MEKEYLIDCVNKNMSINQIAKKNNKSANSVTYWLNKFKLKTNHKSFKDKGLTDYNGIKYCPSCKDDKELSEFYNRRGKEGGSVYCKICTKEEGRERGRKFKIKCVAYKGGECEKCGYNKYIGALEFHHLDPNKKDFEISNVKKRSFNDNIKSELDKCIIVCSNCHREIHGGVNIPTNV